MTAQKVVRSDCGNRAGVAIQAGGERRRVHSESVDQLSVVHSLKHSDDYILVNYIHTCEHSRLGDYVFNAAASIPLDSTVIGGVFYFYIIFLDVQNRRSDALAS